MSRKPEPTKKEQNEYIPSFIAKKPFYLESADTENDYLEHQRLQSAVTNQSTWYDRGKRTGPAATKYRKGACENCGALTHRTKECLSRPRAKGAKWTGKDIQADELVQDVKLGWDAKRDRWNGYDAQNYDKIVEEYEELEGLKKLRRDEQDKSKLSPAEDALGEDRNREGERNEEEMEEEEAKYAEESDMGRRQSNATRNLRIREDTAKYLLNLDLESAKYDPKTRSMIDMGAQADQAAALVAEDNFLRASGDAAEFERAQKYAWETQERGDQNKVHLQANPTSGEFLRKKEQQELDTKRQAHRTVLLEKYGGQEYLQAKEAQNMAVTESERYEEYDDSGSLKKGLSLVQSKSKYDEDVFPNNHTTVWGSWWSNYQWGYACCRSTGKYSYCTGEADQRLEEDINGLHRLNAPAASPHQILAGDRGPPALDHVGTVGLNVECNRPLGKRTLEQSQGVQNEAELEVWKKSRILAGDPMASDLNGG